MSNMVRRSRILVALAAGAAMMAGAAVAQTTAPAPAAPAAAPAAPGDAAAPAKPAPPKPHKKVTPTAVVVVTNNRAVPLAELDVTPAGGGDSKQIVANLAPGKKASVKVAHGKSCVFDLHGIYGDGATTDLPGVDLCKDGKVNLVE